MNLGETMVYDKVYFIGTGKVGSECLKILSAHMDVKKLSCLSVEVDFVPIIKKQCERLNIKNVILSQKELYDYMLSIAEKVLVISAHNQYIFPKAIVAKENITIINFHNAYLPEYRGRNAPTWEIFNQEEHGGATWHLVDASVDTGNIIVQEKVFIDARDTALSLLMKCALSGIKLFKNNVDNFLNETYQIMPKVQPGRLYYSKELPNDGYLDIYWTYDKVCRFLRAMDYKGMDIIPLPLIELEGCVYNIENYIFEDVCPPPMDICA